MADMQLELVAVERTVWSGRASLVVARTVEGDIGVMPGHAPLLAQLREGFAATITESNGTTLRVAVHGGFLSVTKQGVTILAEDADLQEEIDVDTARSTYNQPSAQGAESTRDDTEVRRARAQLLAAGETL